MVTLPLAEDRYRANAVGQIHNGDVLAVAGSRGFGPADVGTVIRDTLRFYRYTAEGSIAGLLTVMPGAKRWGLSVGGMITFPYVPFSADPVWATGSDGFYIAPGGTAEIRVWSSAGVLARIIRWHRPVQPVTAESKETLRQRLIRSARDANARRRQETCLAEAPTASHLPLFHSMLVDDDDNMWLEIYPISESAEPTWDVITRDDEWLGTVRTPSGFSPVRIGTDFIPGVARDELAVERVQMLPLVKGSH